MSIFRKLIIAIVAIVGCAFPSVSQDADTVFLPELIIPGIDEEAYALSQKALRVAVDSSGSESLADLLLRQLPIPINQYGARGQLASINLRGLGPSRTSLVWNNMEINSYTTGQSDLSLINSLGTGSIALNRGSSSPIYGNASLGGTIALTSQSSFDRGVGLLLGQAFGSFGFFNTDVSLDVGAERFSWGFRGNYLTTDNDFPYSFNDEEVKQNNAAYESVNIVPYFAWLLSPSSTLKLDLWYSENDRQIQPGKGNFTNTDRLEDKSYRGVLNYFYDTEKWSWENQVGVTHDHQIYNQNEPLLATRYFVASQVENEISKTLQARAGFNLNAIHVDSDNHDDVREIRNDFFGALSWRPSERIQVNLNARQPMSEGQLKPFSPSVGASWQAVKKKQLTASMNVEASRGFRLPTFNDRYWQPGGNIDLLSETSQNLELGAGARWAGQEVTIQGDFQFFRNDVDNWIIWIPGGREIVDGETISFWYPDNVRRVLATGAEFSVEGRWALGEKSHLSLRHAGTWTRAINKEPLSAFDRSEGKQLPFTPEHVHLTTLTLRTSRFSANVIQSFTSERFTEANNELTPLPGYTLYHLQIARTWPIGEVELLTQASLLNLTDKDYESYENRAMPGINFEFKIKAKYRFR